MNLRLAEIDADKLHKHAASICRNRAFSTIKAGLSDPELLSASFEGTVLAELNRLGSYQADTLGKLACATGIPVGDLYAAIVEDGDEIEPGDVACDRLTEVVTSLTETLTAKAA